MKTTIRQRSIRLTLGALLLSGCNASPSAEAEPQANDAMVARPVEQHPPAIPAAVLRAVVMDGATRHFYEQNGWRPVWSEAASDALDHALARRAAHGLDHIAFLDASLSATTPAKREVARTTAALRFAAALAAGAVDPAELHEIYTIPRPRSDLAPALARALDQREVAQWLAGLAPQDHEYALLSRAYLAFRQEAQGKTGPGIAAAGILRPGDRDDRIATIVEQLIAGEYLPPTASGARPDDARPTAGAGHPDAAEGSNLYTPRIVAAVKHLQRDFGIAADGVIGAQTLEVLNLKPGDRARELAVAMERRRWLSRNPSATRIDVNIAAARLRYFRDGKLADSRKVIAGEPGKETPQLLAPIYRLVANPTWTIPRSIQRGDMANVGSDYLRRHNMIMRHGWIVQKSGPGNALGLVKFDMRDDQAIYLHDTSARSLFDRSQRHLSHGCVRVEDAPGFARLLAKDEGVAREWARARASHDQKFVTLPHHIPVRLLYHNVFVDDDDRVSFRTDPYGWNAKVAQALGFGDTAALQAHADPIDIGP